MTGSEGQERRPQFSASVKGNRKDLTPGDLSKVEN
jgi:hypothetical protein